jgi:hypothetical protein
VTVWRSEAAKLDMFALKDVDLLARRVEEEVEIEEVGSMLLLILFALALLVDEEEEDDDDDEDGPDDEIPEPSSEKDMLMVS